MIGTIIFFWSFLGFVFRIIFFGIILSPENLTLTQAVPNVYKRVLVGILAGPLWWAAYLILTGVKEYFSWIVKP